MRRVVSDAGTVCVVSDELAEVLQAQGWNVQDDVPAVKRASAPKKAAREVKPKPQPKPEPVPEPAPVEEDEEPEGTINFTSTRPRARRK